MSSSSEDDSNMEALLSAVDCNFLSNSLYTSKTDENTNVQTAETTDKEAVKEKSQRYLENEEHPDWVQVSKSTQDHLYGKLTEIISSQIEFTDRVVPALRKSKKSKSKLKLLRGFAEYLQAYEDVEEVFNGPTIKPEIKRRIIEPEYLQNEQDKLEAVSVSSDHILSKEDVKHWTSKRKPKIFEYKAGVDGKCHFKEPTNEFTILRKKNNWSEKYISTKNKIKKNNSP